MWEEDNEFGVLEELDQDRLEDAMYDDSVYGQEDDPPYEDDDEDEFDEDSDFDEEDET